MAGRTIKRIISLDGLMVPEPLPGYMFTGEKQSHTFNIACIYDGQQVTLTGGISGTFLRSDDVTVPLTGTISNGMAVVKLPPQCYSRNGRFLLALFNAAKGDVTTIYAATGNVVRSQSDTVVDVEDIVPDIAELLAEIANMRAATADANEAATAATQAAQEIQTALDAKLDKANVYNALDKTAKGFALDARQGKTLNNAKLDKANVYNALDKTAEGFALDARQGKVLKEIIQQSTANMFKAKYWMYEPSTGATAGTLVDMATKDDLGLTGKTIRGIAVEEVYGGTNVDYNAKVIYNARRQTFVLMPSITQTPIRAHFTVFYTD